MDLTTSDWVQIGVGVTNVLLAGAAFWGVKSARDQANNVQKEAQKDREHLRKERIEEHQLDLVVQIAEDYEVLDRVGLGDAAGIMALTRIKASLYALPVKYLQVLRWEYDVYAHEDERGRIESYGPAKSTKARIEIMGLIQTLTDRGPETDYEPRRKAV